jgi:flagellin
MDASSLGIKSLGVSSFSSAGKAMSAIQGAIDKVSKQRSALGAIQNRLEHTINNLDTTSENTQSAESRIRDTDMASEMVQYSATSIIQQAGQSMLAQANSQTQGVLSLIQ